MVGLLLGIVLAAASTDPVVTVKDTGDAIVVEAEGAQAQSAPAEAPAMTPEKATRIGMLKDKIATLRKRATDLRNLTGTEAPEEVRSRTAQAAEAERNITTMEEEIRQLTEGTTETTAPSSKPATTDQDAPASLQNRRQEMMRGVGEMRQMRRNIMNPQN